jgi:hypothetical protein
MFPAQSASEAHPRQVDESAAQTGVGLLQPLVVVQAPHACAGVQIMPSPHCASTLHATHAPCSASLATSHTPGAHSTSAVHARHVLETGLQMGVTPEHSLLDRHATQTPDDGLQNGVLPPQSVFARHATQSLVVVSQRGVAPVHAPALAAVHSTQAPDGRHTLRPAGHSLLVAHARHWSPSVRSQIGVVPGHCVESLQATHVPTLGSVGSVAQ